jgi:hypothetical protein
MRFLGPAVAALVLLTAPAAAAPPPAGLPGTYHCFQTFSGADPGEPPIWNSSDRVDVTFDGAYSATGNGYTPSTDTVANGFQDLEDGSGRWSWDGSRVVFLDGPFAAPDRGWSLDALYHPGQRAMPHDTEVGRTSPLVIRSLTDQRPGDAFAPATVGHEGEDEYRSTYWYCGDYGERVREVLRDVAPWVGRTARIPVRLPTWMATPLDQRSLHSARALVATRGYYRILMRPYCRNTPCGETAIFSGKRAPASELGHRRRVRLGGGVTGWVGNYGCAFNGDDPDWGPKYCGRTAIVWHQDGVNYCIEGPGLSETVLVLAARQASD